MKWILNFVELGYEVWFMKTRMIPDKYIRIRIYDSGLSKAMELELEKEFVKADSDLVINYIKRCWKEHHNEEME